MQAIPRILSATLLAGAVCTAFAQESTSPPAEPESTTQAEPATNAPISEEISETVEAIRDFSAERRVDAVANARRAADDLDRQMERLQAQTDAQWSRMNDAARARSQATMADLRKRRNALAEWYGGLRHSSASAWGEMRTGFADSFQQLAEAMRKARAEFDREQPQADQAGDRQEPPAENDDA